MFSIVTSKIRWWRGRLLPFSPFQNVEWQLQQNKNYLCLARPKTKSAHSRKDGDSYFLEAKRGIFMIRPDFSRRVPNFYQTVTPKFGMVPSNSKWWHDKIKMCHFQLKNVLRLENIVPPWNDIDRFQSASTAFGKMMTVIFRNGHWLFQIGHHFFELVTEIFGMVPTNSKWWHHKSKMCHFQ